MERKREYSRIFYKLLMIMAVLTMVSIFGTGRGVVHAESYHDYYIYDSSMVSALKSWSPGDFTLYFSKGENVEATTISSTGKTVYGISTSFRKSYSYGIKIHYGNGATTYWSGDRYLCDFTAEGNQLSYIRTGEYSFVVIVGGRKLVVSNGRKTYSSPATYACTFNTNGVGKVNTSSFVEGRVINLADYIPESKHHLVFDGWYYDSQFTRRANYVSLRKNIVLYAKWVIPKKVKRLRVRTPMETLKISWAKKDTVLKRFNIKGYQLRITTANDFSHILVEQLFKKKKTSFKLRVAPGTYYVWIRYYNRFAVSEWEVVPVTVNPYYLTVTQSPAPKLKKPKTHKNKVSITWKKPSEKRLKKYSITGYEVQYSTDPAFITDVRTKSIKKKRSSFEFKGKKKTRYYIRIRYIGAAGASPWSNARTVKIKK